MVLQEILVSEAKTIFERNLVLPAQAVEKRNIKELAGHSIRVLLFFGFLWFLWSIWFF